MGAPVITSTSQYQEGIAYNKVVQDKYDNPRQTTTSQKVSLQEDTKSALQERIFQVQACIVLLRMVKCLSLGQATDFSWTNTSCRFRSPAKPNASSISVNTVAPAFDAAPLAAHKRRSVHWNPEPRKAAVLVFRCLNQIKLDGKLVVTTVPCKARQPAHGLYYEFEVDSIGKVSYNAAT